MVPPEVIARRKMGFSIPLARWLRGDLRAPFEERVFQRGTLVDEMFETRTIRQWWNQHQRGIRDYAYPLWALLFLACWDDRFRRGGA
jgi:asparagine synthase (glutamine-hydrolysing)